MAQEDRGSEEPTLELPSFRLRRRRAKAEPTTGPTTEPTTEPVPGPRAARTASRPPAAPDPVPPPAARPAAATPTAETALDPEPSGLSDAAPTVPPLPAVLLAGVVVGLLAVGLTWLTTLGCDVTRGTRSCGGGPGLLLLLAILGVLSLVGGRLLQALRVPEPRSTGLLAVGLLAVLVLLFLLDSLDSMLGLVAVPGLSAAAFLASHLVTTAVVDD